jgi:hypothetical protein
MEVIAVEAAAVCPAGVAPPATAFEPRTAAAAASLHKNQPAIMGLNRSVGRSYVAVLREWHHRPRSSAACERQDGHEQH